MISGHTRFIAHLGYPTETFKAPMIYNPYFEAAGIDCVVMPMGSKPEDFPSQLPALFALTNIAGALITMPHKVAVVPLLARVSTAVRIAGACNAVRREVDGTLTGDLFDGEGFVRGLERKGRAIAGATILIIGSGGVGSAIAAALAARAPRLMRLNDLDHAASVALAGRLRGHYPAIVIETGSADPAQADIVINASPLGMTSGDPLPCDVARIPPHALVGEVVMKQEITPFLAAAQARGLAVQVGVDMLFEQIPAYLEFFGFPSTTAETLRRLARIAY